MKETKELQKERWKKIGLAILIVAIIAYAIYAFTKALGPPQRGLRPWIDGG